MSSDALKNRLQRVAQRKDAAGRHARILLRSLRKSRGRLTENELEDIHQNAMMWQRPDALAYRAEYPQHVLREELRSAAKYLRGRPHERIAYGPALAYPYRLHSGYGAFEERTTKNRKSKTRRSR